MRPTELQFRSPKQRTAEFLKFNVTSDGRKLSFISQSQNRKRTFPSQQRFPQYRDWEQVTGKFLGPGTYNDGSSFQLLKAQPCPLIYKNQLIGKEAGRQCYQMDGNSMVYQSSYESPVVKRYNSKLNINNKSDVSINAAMGRIKLSTLKQSEMSKPDVKEKLNTLCKSFIHKRTTASRDKAQRNFNLSQIQSSNQFEEFRPQTSYMAMRPQSQMANTVNVDRIQTSHNTRVALKNKLKGENSQSLKKMSMSTNISSHHNRSRIQNQSSLTKMQQNYMSESEANESKLQSNFGDTAKYSMPLIMNQSQASIQEKQNSASKNLENLEDPEFQGKIFYAKTAQNFYNLSRGFTRTAGKSRQQKRVKIDQQIERSINILQAYGEYDNFKKYQQKINGNGQQPQLIYNNPQNHQLFDNNNYNFNQSVAQQNNRISNTSAADQNRSRTKSQNNMSSLSIVHP
eukprot:403376396